MCAPVFVCGNIVDAAVCCCGAAAVLLLCCLHRLLTGVDPVRWDWVCGGHPTSVVCLVCCHSFRQREQHCTLTSTGSTTHCALPHLRARSGDPRSDCSVTVRSVSRPHERQSDLDCLIFEPCAADYGYEHMWEYRQQRMEQKDQQRREARRVAKAAVEAKLIGYEGGFPQSAGGKKDAATLAVAVKSAEHIPVPKEKLQTARDAVVLLLNGQPVQSLQRDGLSYWPVELIDGAAADSFEVVMEAPTLLYRTNAEAQARREQQIAEATKRIADAQATLAELQEALYRSEAALAEAAQSPSANAELSDIGAMVLEQQRIKMEIAAQQATQTAHEKQLADLQKLADSQLQLTEHRITPRFHLQSGFNILSAAVRSLYSTYADQSVQVVHVLKQAQHTVKPVQFSHSVTDAK